MGNVRKFLKYYSPMVLLSVLAGSMVTTFMTNAYIGRLGVSALAASSACSNLVSIHTKAPHAIALAALMLAAIIAEKGKVKTARKIHLIGLIIYGSILALGMILFAADPQVLLRLFASPAEVISMGSSYLRIYALVVLLLAPIAVLPSQLSGKHSFILVVVLCAAIGFFSIILKLLFVNVFRLGLTGMGVADALSSFALSFMPFLMIPVKSYSKAFASSIPE